MSRVGVGASYHTRFVPCFVPMVLQVDQTDGKDHNTAEGHYTVESIMRNQPVRSVAVLNVYLDKIVQKPKDLLALV
jgi:hypothetical protein